MGSQTPIVPPRHSAPNRLRGLKQVAGRLVMVVLAVLLSANGNASSQHDVYITLELLPESISTQEAQTCYIDKRCHSLNAETRLSKVSNSNATNDANEHFVTIVVEPI